MSTMFLSNEPKTMYQRNDVGDIICAHCYLYALDACGMRTTDFTELEIDESKKCANCEGPMNEPYDESTWY